MSKDIIGKLIDAGFEVRNRNNIITVTLKIGNNCLLEQEYSEFETEAIIFDLYKMIIKKFNHLSQEYFKKLLENDN